MPRFMRFRCEHIALLRLFCRQIMPKTALKSENFTGSAILTANHHSLGLNLVHPKSALKVICNDYIALELRGTRVCPQEQITNNECFFKQIF